MNNLIKPKYPVYNTRADEIRAEDACRKWLKGMKPSDKIYLEKSSYQFKHLVEKSTIPEPFGDYVYVFEKTFTDEAIKAGFQVQRPRDGGYPRFNFAEESVRQRQSERDATRERRFDTMTRPSRSAA